jgi:hypothetical protein
MQGVLAAEWDTYLAQKEDLLRRGKGQFVLIHGSRVLGLYATESEGLRAGYREVGLDTPFLLHLVQEEEPCGFLGSWSPPAEVSP